MNLPSVTTKLCVNEFVQGLCVVASFDPGTDVETLVTSTMRLLRCPINGRRRHTSLCRKIALLLVSVALSCWMLLLGLQNIQEQAVAKRNGQSNWYNSVYDVNLMHKEKSFQTVSNSSFVGGSEIHVPSNGRLPKEARDDSLMNPDHHQVASPQIKPSDKGPERQAKNETKEDNGRSDTGDRITERAPPRDGANLDTLPSQNGPDSLQLLRELILKRNQEQKVFNGDKFPPLSSDGLVLVVQVHRREGYLKQLLESLRTVKEIESVLLVVSHDYYYDEMNRIVQSVDFCRVSVYSISVELATGNCVFGVRLT